MPVLNAAGAVIANEFGAVKGAASRPTARVSMLLTPGAENFAVALSQVDAGVDEAWIGSDLIKIIPVADFPAVVSWSEVTAGDASLVPLRGGAVGQPPSWNGVYSRGEVIEEPPALAGAIADMDLFVGGAAVSFSVVPFFTGQVSSYSVLIDGAALPAGSSLVGDLLTINPLVARGLSNVVVTATDAAGLTAHQPFKLLIRAAAIVPPTKSGDPASVVEDVAGSGTISIDFGALVTSAAPLEWTVRALGADTLPSGSAISSTGVFTAPKTAAWPLTQVEAIASNEVSGNGGDVALTSSFKVNAVVATALAFVGEPVFGIKAGSFAAAGGVLTFTGINFVGGTGPHTITTRVYRSAVGLGAGYRASGILDYTIVQADEADAMTGWVRVTDSLGAFVEVLAAGSVAVPVPAVVGAMNQPTAAMTAKAMGSAFHTFAFAANSGQPTATERQVQSNVTNNKGRAFLPQILAIAAACGVTTVIGGQTPAQRLAANLTHHVTNGAPAARGTLNAQVDLGFAIPAMLAKRTPAAWNLITAANKTRIDRVMEGLLVASAWTNSDNNPHVKSGANECSICGGQYGRGRVPNFVTPNHLMPAIVNDYMGGGTAAEDFLKTFDRANFAASIVAAGGTGAGGPMKELWDTFRQTWTWAAGEITNVIVKNGPDAATLQTAVNRGPGGANTRFTQYGGQFISDYAAAMNASILKVHGANITKGAPVGAATKKPTWTAVMPDGFGLFENRAGPTAGRRGRAARVGALTDRVLTQADINNNDASGKATETISGYDAWEAGEHPYGGPNVTQPATGMLTELATTDGGGGTAGSAGPRSSMKYAGEGMVVLLPVLVAFAIRGMVDPNNAAFSAAFGRVHRGMVDWLFRNKYGHRGYAKGGIHGANDGTSRDWFQIDSDGLDWDIGQNLYFEMLQEWAGWPRNTVLPAITGTIKDGSVATCSNGTWTGGGAITKQWQQQIAGIWTNIAGATAGTYPPGTAQVGRKLRTIVKSTNAKGVVLAITNPTVVVAA